MAGEQPPDKVLQGHYVYLKDNLNTNTTLIDELLACGALTDEEKADYRKPSSFKCGSLIKRIIGKGSDTCRQAISVLQNPDYGIYKALQQRDQTIDRENCRFSCNTIRDHRPYFLDELEPSKTADYLFQYDVFSNDIHDEIEAKKERLQKTQQLLHHLEKFPDHMHIFVHILKISNQGYIIDEVLKEGNEHPLTPQEECVNCVRVNFRKIRSNLHFEITSSHLYEEGVIDCKPTTENGIQRGKLVKDAIRHGSTGCESLLKCFKMEVEELFKQILDEWNKQKNFDPRGKIDLTLQREDLDQFEKVFISDLQPSELSDILLELNVITVNKHDNIESMPSRKRKAEVLLTYLKSVPEKLDYFVYALKECREESVLDKIKNREFGEEPIAASTSRLNLELDQGVPQIMPEGVLPERLGLALIMEEINNPGSQIKKVVSVVNKDPTVKIKVVEDTYMSIEKATDGSVVIHLCPLTDTAIERFFEHDGSRVQAMIKKLLESAGLQDILEKSNKEIEMSVKIIKKEPSSEEKIKRSQDPYDIMRRKIQENEAHLVDELEPSQLTSFLVHKDKQFVELEREIEQQKGRRQRGKKLLEKIRTSSESQILESFKEFMDSIGRKDLIELVQFSPKDTEDHEKAESIRNILIPNYTNVVEEIETCIIKETLQKFVKIHNIKEEYKSFLPETGKSRQDRVHRFLTFVFQKDEYVIELEKVFRQNNLDHLLEPKKQEDYFEPSKKRKLSSSSTLKEGELFDCTYKVVLSKGPGPKGLEKMEVDYPQPAHREQSRSFDTPKGYPSGSSDGEKNQKYTHELEIPASSATTSESTTEEPAIVVAIDFGTTYSGFAYALSDSPSEIFIEKWNAEAADTALASLKTPTSLLLDNENNFKAFGYEAEKLYEEYAEDKKHEKIRFFKNFKMQLHQKREKKSLDIEDHMGKPLEAMEVFSKAIEYLKKKFLESLKKKKEITEKDIHWVVTVPAIWDEFSKQFMKLAAEKANIPSKQLSLALEPEVAAIHVLMDTMMVNSTKGITKHEPGTKLLVADLGGGTADFSLMEITEEGKLSLLHKPTGGDLGGNKINEEILKIFTEIFGPKVMEKFKDEKAEFLQMEKDIELKKREMKPENKLSVTLLPALTGLCIELHDKDYMKMIEESKYADRITVKRGKMLFNEQLVFSICEPVAKNIADHIKEILKNSKTNDVETIILVGGFANSNCINEYLNKEFVRYDVKTPTDPELAVLKGAVRYGQNINMITERVCEYTYGVEAYRSYTIATDPEDKIKKIGGKTYCTGLFQKIIEIGKRVRVDEEIKTEVKATTPKMTEMEVNIYRSKKPNPLFITDGCEKFASMKVKMPNTKGGTGRVVTVGMTLGRTEITFLCHDKTSGNKEELSVKYYG